MNKLLLALTLLLGIVIGAHIPLKLVRALHKQDLMVGDTVRFNQDLIDQNPQVALVDEMCKITVKGIQPNVDDKTMVFILFACKDLNNKTFNMVNVLNKTYLHRVK